MEDKDERMVEFAARMHAPLEWNSIPGCKIQDLNESHYDEAVHLIKHHFFTEEPMCKASSLSQDQPSLDQYLERIRTLIKDTTSLVALSAASGRVVGVAVTRINSHSEKTNTYSRVQVFEGEALEKIMHLISVLIKQADAYTVFGHDEYLRIYVLCVHPSYQRKGVGTALLKACVQMSGSLKMPAVGGVFTSYVSQTMARRAGFRLISEIRYGRWIVDEEIVFDDPGRGNYSAAFMGMLLPDADSEDERQIE